MSSRRGLKVLAVFLAAFYIGGWAIPRLLESNSSIPPSNQTGSPGDGASSCTSCHSGPAGSAANVSITGLPSSWAANQTYPLTVYVSTSAGQIRPGFELVAEKSGGAAVGSYGNFDGNSQAVGDGAGHKNASTGVLSWSFDWTAPAAGQGTITFYMAGNASNNNGNTTGDQINLGSFAVAEGASAPSLSSLQPAFGSLGSTIAITGTDFTSTVSTVNFEGGASTATVLSWADSLILVLATGSASGNVAVTNANGTSSGAAFELITQAPKITSTTPTLLDADAASDSLEVHGLHISTQARIELSTTTPGVPVSSAGATGVTISTTILASGATFDLVGLVTGYWTLTVTNPDGRSVSHSSSVLVQKTPAAPADLAGAALSSTTIRWSWTGLGGNIDGFRLLTDTAGAASPDLAGSASSFDEGGFSPNEISTRGVQAFNAAGSSASAVISTATNANAPLSAASTFTAVQTASLTAAWESGGNTAGTRYDAAVSTSAALVDTDTGNVSVSTAPEGPPSAPLAGLAANTTYFLFVRTVGRFGQLSGYAALGSTATRAEAPASAVSTFSASSSGGFTGAWDANGNPAGTLYEAKVSTATPLVETDSGVVAVSTRPEGAPSAAFSGLIPNTTYYFFAQALDHGGTPTGFTTLGATATPAALPISAASTFTVVEISSIAVQWDDGGNPPGTLYAATISTDNFISINASSETAATSVLFGSGGAGNDLSGSTTYYFGVRARGVDGTQTAFLFLGSTITLANLPGGGTGTLAAGSSTAATGSWSANGNPAGTLYEAVIATGTPLALTDSGNVAVSTRPEDAPSAFFSGLSVNTTYHLFVRAYNPGGTPGPYTLLASTPTLADAPGAAVSSFSAVEASSAVFAWSLGANPAGTRFEAQVSTDTFATLNASSDTAGLSALFGSSGQGPDLAANATHHFRVRALARDGTPSPFAAEQSTVTLPAAPLSLAAVAVSSTDLTLSWGVNGNAADTPFEVSYSSADAFATGNAISTAGATTSSFTVVASLAENATYYFRVRALGRTGRVSAFSATASTKTSAPVPGAPGTPSATALGVSSISWTWTAAVFADIYEIVLASDAATVLASTPTTAFTAAGLSTNTALGIAVRGLNAAGTGPLSAGATAFTLAAPAASLAISTRASNSIELAWSANTNPAGTRFELTLSTDAFAAHFSTPVPLAAGLTGSATGVEGLTLATTYYFRVRAFNGDDLPSAFSATLSTATLLHPNPPTGFAGVVQSSSSILWSWTDASGDEAFFRVLSATGGVLSPDLPAGTTEWLQSGLLPDTSAENHAVSVSTAGNPSPGSNAIRLFTFALAPSSPSASAVAGSSLSLRVSWSTAAASGYSLERSTFSGGGFSEAASSATLTAGATAHLDTDLASGTSYFYRLRGFNGDGVPTGYSAEASAQTGGALPTAPALSGIPISSTTILWSWTAQQGVSSYGLFASTGGLVAPLSGAATSFAESSLTPGTTYARFLRAANGTGEAFSSTITVATPQQAAEVPAAAPSAFSVTGASVSIPSGALGGAGVAMGSPDPVVEPLVPGTPGDIAAANANLSLLSQVPGSIRQFLAFVGGVRKTDDFASPVTVSISYADADNDGIVDGTAISENSLSLYTLQEGGSSWSAVPGSSVDAANNSVSAPVSHFTIFSIIGGTPGSNLDAVKMFPNPLRPSRGHTAMNFTNLPAGANIRIYTLAGERVGKFDAAVTGQAAWDGRNESGRPVASGVYLVVIESGGSKKLFKAAVQK